MLARLLPPPRGARGCLPRYGHVDRPRELVLSRPKRGGRAATVAHAAAAAAAAAAAPRAAPGCSALSDRLRLASGPARIRLPMGDAAGSGRAASCVLSRAGSKYYNGAGSLTTLTTWLLQQERKGAIDLDMFAVLSSIASACKQISALVATAPVAGRLGAYGETNASGDEQKKLDVLANDIFVAAVTNCGRTAITVSEEEDKPVAVESVAGGRYIACFDPIDGSSNIDACISTGSIFGIYKPGECVIDDWDDADAILEKCLMDVKRSGTDLACAGYCLYSSATVLVLSVGTGVWGFTLDTLAGEFYLTHPDMKIPDPGQRIYSGNEGNTQLWAPELREYLQELKQPSDGSKPYTYRYIGALCPDFHRVLLYGGIWLYPPDATAPQGKARLLYEVAPMSFLAEQAGGVACIGPLADVRVIEVVPQEVHQKSPLFCGSTTEMKKLQAFLKDRAAAKA